MNECTICFETMDIKKNKVTMCYYCGKCVHTKCYRTWQKKSGKVGINKCLYCQVEGNLYKINRSCWQQLTECCFN